jgi:hypothetical protein
VRWFLTRRTPRLERILIVESGARSLTEQLLAVLRKLYGPEFQVDLFTCFSGVPAAEQLPFTNIFRSHEYPDWRARKAFLSRLRSMPYSAIAIICSDEPLLFRWKWLIALAARAKVMIVNENVDFFWLDYSHSKTILRFLLYRAGLTGAAALPTLIGLLVFPFSVAFLAGYALFVHARRLLRGANVTIAR